MTTTEQLAEALAQARPALDGGAQALARRAERELRRWGHEGHVVDLERVTLVAGRPGALRWLFWCESGHVSQLLVLDEPAVR